MRPLKRNLALALLTTGLSLTSVTALCEKGNGVGGGGDIVNHKLVEDHVVDDASELPDFNETEKYLKIFEERVPGFADKLKKIAHPNPNDPKGVIWYLVPRKLNEFCQQQKMPFATNRAACQNDDEIYVSSTSISDQGLADEDGISPLDPKALRGRLYLHELLMMVREDKDVKAVHKLMVFLKRKNYAPTDVELAKMLDGLGFGFFVTQSKVNSEKAIQAESKVAAAREAEKVLAQFISESKTICRDNLDSVAQLGKLQNIFLASYYMTPIHPDFSDAVTKSSEFRHAGSYLQTAQGKALDAILSRNHMASLAGALKLGSPAYGEENMFTPLRQWAERQTYELSIETRNKIHGYVVKYQNQTVSQRVNRICEDVSGLESAAPAATLSAPATSEPTSSGE